MTFKKQVHNRCLELMEDKISLLKKTLQGLTESAANESKSTAGDKHETALAMLQIEQENTGRQLKDALANKLVLNQINIHHNPTRIANGSLVKTNQGYLFLSIALGRIAVNDTNLIALSPQSPLGMKLAGLRLNDRAEMNGTTYIIEDIF